MNRFSAALLQDTMKPGPSAEGPEHDLSRFLSRFVEGTQAMTEDDQAADAPKPEFTKEEFKRAMKAFKRRLKLMRLDHESTLGGRQLTSGRKSGIAGITPPDQYPKEIWQALCERGRLKYVGQGLYEIVEVS